MEVSIRVSLEVEEQVEVFTQEDLHKEMEVGIAQGPHKGQQLTLPDNMLENYFKESILKMGNPTKELDIIDTNNSYIFHLSY